MKKLTVIAMGALMALTMVGCGGNKSKNLNISVFTIQQRQQPPADNRDYKWLEEEFGVTFTWDILNGDKDQKIGTIIASGDLPDLVEVDSENDDGTDSSDSSTKETRVYSIKYEQFDDEEQYPICAWIKDELVSNYHEKVNAAKENKDAFDLKWFKGVVNNGSTEDAATLKVHQAVNFSSQAEGASEEFKKQLDNLNVEIDVELTSVGVMTYKIYNAETIDGKPNKDKYIMTLTVDIDVPCKRSVDVEVDVEETGEGENKKTKTTTTTTYTNEYTFDFRIRDIKKG